MPWPLRPLALTALMIILLAVLALWLWTPDRDRAELERLYLAAPTDMVDVLGAPATHLHVRDSGPKDAPAVILLHGFGASLHTWELWASGLAATHRVIRFDLPGSGLSPPDPSGDYTDVRSRQLLLALMDHLGLARASLVGHSIGGRIAWGFAAERPNRVDKLVLVAPDGFASPGFAYGKAPEVPASFKLMRHALPMALLRLSLEPAYADPALLTDDVAERYHDLMRAPGSRDALLARMAQTVLTDPLPVLRRIRAPTLLLWGEQDAMIPFANSADYLQAIPQATRVALPGVGHLPHEEAPERSLAPVLAFLR
ncbi:MAG: hydrolase [Methylibium sp. NZG]|nr:MAG: hydrolase [Methylibium sp. NZG]